jgi:hypothetical protein
MAISSHPVTLWAVTPTLSMEPIANFTDSESRTLGDDGGAWKVELTLPFRIWHALSLKTAKSVWLLNNGLIDIHKVAGVTEPGGLLRLGSSSPDESTNLRA